MSYLKSERLRLSGRVLDLGLKGRRFESTLHLTEVFFLNFFRRRRALGTRISNLLISRWRIRFFRDFQLQEMREKASEPFAKFRSYPRQTVTSPQRKRSPMPSMNWSLGDTGLKGCQPFPPS